MNERVQNLSAEVEIFTILRETKDVITDADKNLKTFEMISEYCHLTKNLYNHSNYILRQTFIGKGEIISYC